MSHVRSSPEHGIVAPPWYESRVLSRASLATLLATLFACDKGPSAPPAPPASPDACVRDVGCPVCAPGSTRCGADGLSPARCADDGLRWIESAHCDESRGEVCEDDRCVPACAELDTRRETRGCEFWPAQTLNSTAGRYGAVNRRDEFPFALVVNNAWPSRVRVTLDGGGLASPVAREIAPRGSVTLEVPWQPALSDASDPARRVSTLAPRGALHLVATAPVTAYQFNPLKFIRSPDCDNSEDCFSFSNDASLLLPAHVLGRSHVVATVPTVRVLPTGSTMWTSAPGFVTVVGTRPDTRVTFRLRANTVAGSVPELPARRAGETLELTLGAGDVVQVLSAHDPRCARTEEDRLTLSTFCLPVEAEDLTGTVVTSSAPVAVYAGHDCALVPYNRYACDHLEEQVPPVETLGQRYVVTRAEPADRRRNPTHPEGEPTLAVIVAAFDDTSVTFEPPSVHAPARLMQGEALRVTSLDDYSVVGDKALAVASVLVGAGYWPQDTPVDNTSRGDPSLSFETPVEQYRHAYDFVAPDGFSPAFANVTLARGARFTLDGTAWTGAPSATVGARDVYRVPVLAGVHHIEGATRDTRFGLRVYGYALYTSFMYPGGGDLRPITVPQ